MTAVEQKALDREWSLAVRERDHHVCRYGWPGCRGHATDATHIFTRKYRELRWELANGLAGCRHCHMLSERDPKRTLAFVRTILKPDEWQVLVSVMRAHYGKNIEA